jgi:hypothetical protein
MKQEDGPDCSAFSISAHCVVRYLTTAPCSESETVDLNDRTAERMVILLPSSMLPSFRMTP